MTDPSTPDHLARAERTMVRRDAVDELIDQIAGTVLTNLSGGKMFAQHRCGRGSGSARDSGSLSFQGGPVEPAAAR
jgi:hypothetical protein